MRARALLFVSASLVFAQGQGPRLGDYRSCPTQRNPIFKAVIDPSTGKYLIVDNVTTDTDTDIDMQDDDLDGTGDGISSILLRKCSFCNSRLWGTNNNNTALIYYCPLQFIDCSIPLVNILNDPTNSSDKGNGNFTTAPWLCVNKIEAQDFFVRNFWPALLIYLGGIFILLFTSQFGRDAQNFVYAKCVRDRNRRLVQLMIERNPRRAKILIQQFQARECQRQERRALVGHQGGGVFGRPLFGRFFSRLGTHTNAINPSITIMDMQTEQHQQQSVVPVQGSPGQKCSLVLKTKRYIFEQHQHLNLAMLPIKDTSNNSVIDDNDDDSNTMGDNNHNHHHDEEEGITCTICFGTIENGNRIGDLPCVHLFHLDCLKSWLIRKNACPMCQREGVADIRYDDEEHE